MALDLNPFDEGGIFGSGDAEDAKELDAQAIKDWEDFEKQVRSIDLGLEVGYGPGQINEYKYLNPLEATSIEYVDPGDSAFSSLGPSAFSDLRVDPRSRASMESAQSYFSDLMKSGADPIAEADYARRTAAAEQARRANTEAALRELEARGQGGAGQQLLAELSNTQASASDQYLAGLDANAMAAARRDAAAGNVASIGGQIGAMELTADQARASGLDTFDTNRAAAEDAWNTWDWGNYYDTEEWNANTEYDARTRNWDRGNQVSDRNTDVRNQTTTWNKVGAPQQQFDWLFSTLGAKTGATTGAAQGLRQNAVYPFQDIALPAFAAGAEAYGVSQQGKK